MPFFRLVGNAALSLLSKLSSGYWGMMDPTNGYTAINSRIAAVLLQQDIAHRYFFESDVLCHLGMLQAVVRDVPMDSRYGDTMRENVGTSALIATNCDTFKPWLSIAAFSARTRPPSISAVSGDSIGLNPIPL
jgi:hypothetical protein